jgi:hypothetical protein
MTLLVGFIALMILMPFVFLYGHIEKYNKEKATLTINERLLVGHIVEGYINNTYGKWWLSHDKSTNTYDLHHHKLGIVSDYMTQAEAEAIEIISLATAEEPKNS